MFNVNFEDERNVVIEEVENVIVVISNSGGDSGGGGGISSVYQAADVSISNPQPGEFLTINSDKLITNTPIPDIKSSLGIISINATDAISGQNVVDIDGDGGLIVKPFELPDHQHSGDDITGKVANANYADWAGNADTADSAGSATTALNAINSQNAQNADFARNAGGVDWENIANKPEINKLSALTDIQNAATPPAGMLALVNPGETGEMFFESFVIPVTPTWDTLLYKPDVFPADPSTIPAQGWGEITGKPIEFSPTPHNQGWDTITGKPDVFPGDPINWLDVQDKPLVYPADPSTVPPMGWAEITGKPIVFTPDTHTQGWDTITGKPTTFAPSSHNQDWSTITGKPSVYPADPATIPPMSWIEITGKPLVYPADPATISPMGWAEITGKPIVFTPDTHTQGWDTITGKPSVIGDMTKSVYDTDGDGKVNNAVHADSATSATSATSAGSVPWTGVTGKPTVGDMLASTYDTDSDGKVNSAVHADSATSATSATSASSVPWSGVTGAPTIPVAVGKWNPLAAPLSPSAYDDEFDVVGSINAKWSRWDENPSPYSNITVDDFGAYMWWTNPQTASWAGWTQPFVSFTTKRFAIDAYIPTCTVPVGIGFLGLNSGVKIGRELCFYNDGTNFKIFYSPAANYTDSVTFTAAYSAPLSATGYWLRMLIDHTNSTSAKINYYFSSDGFSFKRMTQETVPYTSIDKIGFFTNLSVTSYRPRVCSFRVREITSFDTNYPDRTFDPVHGRKV